MKVRSRQIRNSRHLRAISYGDKTLVANIAGNDQNDSDRMGDGSKQKR